MTDDLLLEMAWLIWEKREIQFSITAFHILSITAATIFKKSILTIYFEYKRNTCLYLVSQTDELQN